MSRKYLQSLNWSKSSQSGQMGHTTGSADNVKCNTVDAKISPAPKCRLQLDFVPGIRI